MRIQAETWFIYADYNGFRCTSTWYVYVVYLGVRYLKSNSMLQIPKPNQQEGLGITWPAQETNMDKLKEYFNQVKAKM